MGRFQSCLGINVTGGATGTEDPEIPGGIIADKGLGLTYLPQGEASYKSVPFRISSLLDSGGDYNPDQCAPSPDPPPSCCTPPILMGVGSRYSRGGGGTWQAERRDCGRDGGGGGR